MSTTIETLSDDRPTFFNSQDKALAYHYRNTGYLWKLKEAFKNTNNPLFVQGIMKPQEAWRYDLYMVNGYAPTEQDILKFKTKRNTKS